MKRVKIVLAIILAVVTVVLLGTTIFRLTWDYNENGVYFDEGTVTTYNDGAVIGYCLLTIVFFVPTVVIIMNLKKVEDH